MSSKLRKKTKYLAKKTPYLVMLLFKRVRKIRKATVSFVMWVRMEQLDSHWTDFHEIRYLSIFRKSVGKIHVSH